MDLPAPSAADADGSTERAARVHIGRPGTVRDRERFVVDVAIEDLSTTGCLFRGDFALEVGALVTIGITGIGMHVARVTRLVQDGAGCAFLLPLTEDDVATATVAETVQTGCFVQMKSAIRSAAQIEHNRRAEDRQQPLSARLKRAFRIARGRS